MGRKKYAINRRITYRIDLLIMGHAHHHHHSGDSVGNIKAAFFLNLGFTVIEFIGGVFVNSVAIISDAIHDLGDSVSLGLSWYFQNLAQKGRTRAFSYGFGRFSVLSAVINTLVLLLGSIFILMETIPRLLAPEQPDVQGMILLSILGIVVNGVAVLKTRKGKTANEKVVSLHLLEDVLGWVAVLIGSIVMIFVDLPIIDPLLSLAITAYILKNVFVNLKNSLNIMLQGTPPELNIEKIENKLMAIPGIKEVHDTHTWSMDGEFNIMTLHLVLENEEALKDRIRIKKDARSLLKHEAIDHVTIELEIDGEKCDMEDC